MSRIIASFILSCAFVQTVVASEPAGVSKRFPAFPEAEGAGAYTPGGRGGKILLVTTLDDYNPKAARPQRQRSWYDFFVRNIYANNVEVADKEANAQHFHRELSDVMALKEPGSGQFREDGASHREGPRPRGPIQAMDLPGNSNARRVAPNRDPLSHWVRNARARTGPRGRGPSRTQTLPYADPPVRRPSRTQTLPYADPPARRPSRMRTIGRTWVSVCSATLLQNPSQGGPAATAELLV